MSFQTLQQIFKNASQGDNIQALSKLLTYGRQKGFQNFINRKVIWPYLLNINTQNLSSSIYQWQQQLDRNSSDYQQLQKDAERSLATMKTFQNITKFHLQKKQRDVLKILDSFFAKNKKLKYIQGFHDVASIFLVLFGNNTGYYLMQKAGTTYFKDFLTTDIGTLSTQISEIVMQLLISKDQQFQKIFQCFKEMNLIIFIVPWVLTWFAHVFSSVKTICRIWDYIFCTGPQGIIYLTAGILLSTKGALISQCPQLDQPSIHIFYQQIVKKQNIDIQESIKLAIELQNRIDIESLVITQKIHDNSMFLKNTFELHIDFHRRVKEFRLMKEKQEARKRIMITIVGFVASAAIGLGYLYFKNKKLVL